MQYRRLKTLFFRAADLDSDRRDALLERECARDPALGAVAKQLVLHSNNPSEALNHIFGLGDSVDGGLWPIGPPRTAAVPARIGDYRIIRKLGEGSMGIVYEAEQQRPRRTVALKIIRGVPSAAATHRFEHESQILGLLQHPAIAQVYDAGTANLGSGPQPFFAMELIRGIPLTDYAKTHGTSISERLEMFTAVGEAVHHAHQKGVIHRDLKPDNILVDAQGRAKVLDFGVARVTGDQQRVTAMCTGAGQVIGTLSYMSPEQAAGRPEHVDIRSDVHALGAILFELLTDRLPYDVRGMMIHSAVRVIRDDQPARLGAVNRCLRGDLDVIVSKALEKDPARRYQSALELTSDVKRYLQSRPIVARPPSAIYQLRKYAQRHKAMFGAVAAAFVLLVLGVMGTSVGLVRATQQRQRAEAREREAVQARTTAQAARADAERSRDQAEAVTAYLESMLASASPEELGRDVLVRDVLNQATTSIAERFDSKPLIEARMRRTIGITYRELGDLDQAADHLESALAIRRQALPVEHPDTLASMNDLAELYHAQGRYNEAESLLTTTLEKRRRILGRENEHTLVTAGNLAVLYEKQGRLGDAEALAIDTLEAQRGLLGDGHPATLTTTNTLATVYLSQGRYAEAETSFLEALELLHRVLGPEHPDTLGAMNNLGSLYSSLGRLDDAEPLLAQVVEIRKRVLGEDHAATLVSMNNLAGLYWRRARYDEAEALFADVLDLRRKALGESHKQTLTSMFNLAVVYRTNERFAEAEPLIAESLRIRRRVFGPEHADTLASLAGLCGLYQEQGRVEDAEPLCVETLATRRRVLGAEHPDTIASLTALGRLYTTLGRYTGAEALLAEAVDAATRLLPGQHWTRGNALSYYGQCLSLQGRHADAEPALLDGHAALAAGLGPSHRRTLQSINDVADFYDAWEKTQAAAAWRALRPSARSAQPPN